MEVSNFVKKLENEDQDKKIAEEHRVAAAAMAESVMSGLGIGYKGKSPWVKFPEAYSARLKQDGDRHSGFYRGEKRIHVWSFDLELQAARGRRGLYANIPNFQHSDYLRGSTDYIKRIEFTDAAIHSDGYNIAAVEEVIELLTKMKDILASHFKADVKLPSVVEYPGM